MAKSGYVVQMDKCTLPVTPSKIQIKINNGNETVTLINEGEINILKMEKLTDIEFECSLPQVKRHYAFYPSGFQLAQYYLDYFEALKKSMKPFQFIVSRKLPNGTALTGVNMKVSLEAYTITEDAKDGFDMEVSIKLKQWRDYGTKTELINLEELTAASVPNREENNSPAPAEVKSYTVVAGDCLWTIAKQFYGNGAYYSAIYDANRDIIGGNPNLIIPGQVLAIPAVDADYKSTYVPTVTATEKPTATSGGTHISIAGHIHGGGGRSFGMVSKLVLPLPIQPPKKETDNKKVTYDYSRHNGGGSHRSSSGRSHGGGGRVF